MENEILQNKDLKKTKKIIFTTILIGISFFLGLLVGVSNSDNPNFIHGEQKGELKNKKAEAPDYLSKNVDFKLFWKTWDTIRDKYIDSSVLDSQMFYGALSGLVASLNDPYSIFLPPDTTKAFNEELEGKFEGIGAEIGIKDEKLTIIAPLPNSPAEKSGLQAGDKILAIDQIDTSFMTPSQAAQMIRGDKGTTVTLTIKHGEEKEKDITITRDEIYYESIKTSTGNAQTDKLLNDKNIAYIKITNFNQDTEALFEKAVQNAINKKYIILDLRNNPGGFLTTAIKVSSYWVENNIIVKEVSQNKEKIQNFSSNGVAKLKDKKTVILVNQGSASAAEIVAGALQDYGLATIVGETTFGKGSVQDLTKLSDGSSIKLTIAKWLTPNDRAIDQEGIKPDIEIKISDEEYNNNKDPQLDKAIELLQ
ncbi:MAG TPA: S41 family peptidase [bacterium]|jgi:carboxyl-terminal processing protease|nr:S41 family peptidase [bacterium]HOG38045.1 S41 family peptidase [bacterium]